MDSNIFPVERDRSRKMMWTLWELEEKRYWTLVQCVAVRPVSAKLHRHAAERHAEMGLYLIIMSDSLLPRHLLFHLLPRTVRIEKRHGLSRLLRLLAQVFLVHLSLVVHDKGHDPGGL